MKINSYFSPLVVGVYTHRHTPPKRLANEIQMKQWRFEGFKYRYLYDLFLNTENIWIWLEEIILLY